MNILGVMLLSAANRRLVRHFPLDRLLRGATLAATAAAILLAVLACRGTGGIWGIALPVFLMFSMNGIIASCANAAALAAVESRMAGSAAALIGSLQYGSGILSTLLLTRFADGTPWPMAAIITVFVALSAVTAWAGSHKNARPEPGVARTGG